MGCTRQYAIIGVTFYDSRAPDDFGNLSRAVSWTSAHDVFMLGDKRGGHSVSSPRLCRASRASTSSHHRIARTLESTRLTLQRAFVAGQIISMFRIAAG